LRNTSRLIALRGLLLSNSSKDQEQNPYSSMNSRNSSRELIFELAATTVVSGSTTTTSQQHSDEQDPTFTDQLVVATNSSSDKILVDLSTSISMPLLAIKSDHTADPKTAATTKYNTSTSIEEHLDNLIQNDSDFNNNVKSASGSCKDKSNSSGSSSKDKSNSSNSFSTWTISFKTIVTSTTTCSQPVSQAKIN
jgi:hypothetical protein